jgi:hypothetical protein
MMMVGGVLRHAILIIAMGGYVLDRVSPSPNVLKVLAQGW